MDHRRPVESAHIGQEEFGEVSPLVLLGILARHRRTMIGLPAAVFSVVVGILLWRGDNTATTAFLPQVTNATASQVAGLAAEFGITLGGGGPGESVDFYTELVKSRTLLARLATTEYRFAKTRGGADTLHGNLIALYKIDEDTPQEQLQSVLDRLDDDVAVRKSVESGIVTVEVTAPWPELAEQMASHLLVLVSEFNVQERQSQASAERKFLEGRLNDARTQLRNAEIQLQRFLEENRHYADSPRLAFEASRLQRQIDLQQQVYTTLAQSYEQARIQEVRNTPVFTIIDDPVGSAEPDRRIWLKGVLGAFLGALIGLGIVLFSEYINRERATHPEDYGALAGLVEDIRRVVYPSFARRAVDRATSAFHKGQQ